MLKEAKAVHLLVQYKIYKFNTEYRTNKTIFAYS